MYSPCEGGGPHASPSQARRPAPRGSGTTSTGPSPHYVPVKRYDTTSFQQSQTQDKSATRHVGLSERVGRVLEVQKGWGTRSPCPRDAVGATPAARWSRHSARLLHVESLKQEVVGLWRPLSRARPGTTCFRLQRSARRWFECEFVQATAELYRHWI